MNINKIIDASYDEAKVEAVIKSLKNELYKARIEAKIHIFR